MLTISEKVKLVKKPVSSGPIGNRNKPIELHTQVYPAYTPPEWYENTSCMKVYNELINSWNSRFVEGYMNGVECGWYRTARVLYPGITNITEIERLYTRFVLEHGREFKMGEGQGILDATDAAIKAFKNCR